MAEKDRTEPLSIPANYITAPIVKCPKARARSGRAFSRRRHAQHEHAAHEWWAGRHLPVGDTGYAAWCPGFEARK